METPDLTNVIEAAGRLRAAANGDVAHLLAEHRFAHEGVLFPALATRCDSVQPLLAELVSEHRDLDALARTGSPDHRDELRARLARHLDVEHHDVLPLFYRHFDADEFTVLDAVINQHQQENSP